MELRIKECLKEHNMKQIELADKMGIKPISLSQMLARKKFGIDRLEQMADIIGCSVTDLFAEEKQHCKQNDFAAYIRYKGIHYTADTIEEFAKIADEVLGYAKD